MTILILFTLTAHGQSIEVETERIKSATQVEVESFNGCCTKKGYRAVYTFDKDGRAIECSNFFKRKLMAKHKYAYNDAGLLTEEIQVYDINNKNRIDTTHYDYKTDTTGKILSKKMVFGPGRCFSWTYYYKDFNEYGFPGTIVWENEQHQKRTQLRTYDALGNIIQLQEVENDSVITTEERKYNPNGDLAFSNLPSIVGQDTKGLALFIGGNRYSAIENYEYAYDKLNRWTEKYVIYDGKKMLLEKRNYR